MRAYTIERIKVNKKKHGLWEAVLHITCEPDSATDYGFFASWFGKYHPDSMIFAHYESTIQGRGFTFGKGKKKGIVPVPSPGDGQLRLTHYEIRCKKEAADYLVDKFTIPEKERKEYEEYKIKQRNQGNGWIVIDGKGYSVNDLMPKPPIPFIKTPRIIPPNPFATELAAFIKSMTLKGDSAYKLPHYSYHINPPFNDFNRDIHHPGQKVTDPRKPKTGNALKKEEAYIKFLETNGAVRIMADDDFWCVALLPYSMKDLTIQEIVAVLWPDKAPIAHYHGDHDDKEYWDKYYASARNSSKGKKIE